VKLPDIAKSWNAVNSYKRRPSVRLSDIQKEQTMQQSQNVTLL